MFGNLFFSPVTTITTRLFTIFINFTELNQVVNFHRSKFWNFTRGVFPQRQIINIGKGLIYYILSPNKTTLECTAFKECVDRIGLPPMYHHIFMLLPNDGRFSFGFFYIDVILTKDLRDNVLKWFTNSMVKDFLSVESYFLSNGHSLNKGCSLRPTKRVDIDITARQVNKSIAVREDLIINTVQGYSFDFVSEVGFRPSLGWCLALCFLPTLFSLQQADDYTKAKCQKFSSGNLTKSIVNQMLYQCLLWYFDGNMVGSTVTSFHSQADDIILSEIRELNKQRRDDLNQESSKDKKPKVDKKSKTKKDEPEKRKLPKPVHQDIDDFISKARPLFKDLILEIFKDMNLVGTKAQPSFGSA